MSDGKSRDRGWRLAGIALLGVAVLVLGCGRARAESDAETRRPQPVARAQMDRAQMDRATPPLPARLPTQTALFEPAPLPNQDLLPPASSVAKQHAELGPGLLRRKIGYQGDGYVPGSGATQTDEPRHMPLPGITLKVPLN
jgi:hypothetical protein